MAKKKLKGPRLEVAPGIEAVAQPIATVAASPVTERAATIRCVDDKFVTMIISKEFEQMLEGFNYDKPLRYMRGSEKVSINHLNMLSISIDDHTPKIETQKEEVAK